MAGKRRTLWRGTLYLGNDRGGADDDEEEEDEEDEEELSIAITTHQHSMRGEETFDWVERRDEASLTRCPRSCLRETQDMRPYIRNSQSVEVSHHHSFDILLTVSGHYPDHDTLSGDRVLWPLEEATRGELLCRTQE